MAFMGVAEVWFPFALAFPHAALASELIDGPNPTNGGGACCTAVLLAPITHGIYGAIMRHESWIGLSVAALLHIICFLWSLKLPNPFLA
jgi:hypothetical protein